MTYEQFEATYRELLDNVRASLLHEGKRLYHSGAIAVNDYADNYELPRIVLTVALENEGKMAAPDKSLKHWWTAIRNLRHF